MTAGTSPRVSSVRAHHVPTTMTLEGLNEDFRDLLILFADGGVEFVIVGAYALAFHGAPRASGDIDLFVRPSPVNALPPRRIDLLTEISGLSFDEAWASRTPAEVDGRTVSFIGREALLKNKEASGRIKDIADVARLRKNRPAEGC